MTAIFAVLQHSPRSYIEKYFHFILTSAKNGDLSLQEVAMLEDRLLMESGEKQKYGTQIVTDRETGQKKIYPLIDPKNVNERRKEMRMGLIEDYLKRWNIEFKTE